VIRFKLEFRPIPSKETKALPETSEALSKSNDAPDPHQVGIVFMKPNSAPGYIIVSTDTTIPRHTTVDNARGGTLVNWATIMRIKKMVKRGRLTAPQVSGDLIL